MPKNLERHLEPVLKPLPVNEGHNMLTVIETIARPSTMKQLELHAVDLIDRNLPLIQKVGLVAIFIAWTVIGAATIVHAF